jgi:hypothetical protein
MPTLASASCERTKKGYAHAGLSDCERTKKGVLGTSFAFFASFATPTLASAIAKERRKGVQGLLSLLSLFSQGVGGGTFFVLSQVQMPKAHAGTFFASFAFFASVCRRQRVPTLGLSSFFRNRCGDGSV